MVARHVESPWKTFGIQTFVPHPRKAKQVFHVFHIRMNDRNGMSALAKVDFPTFLHSLLLLSFLNIVILFI